MWELPACIPSHHGGIQNMPESAHAAPLPARLRSVACIGGCLWSCFWSPAFPVRPSQMPAGDGSHVIGTGDRSAAPSPESGHGTVVAHQATSGRGACPRMSGPWGASGSSSMLEGHRLQTRSPSLCPWTLGLAVVVMIAGTCAAGDRRHSPRSCAQPSFHLSCRPGHRITDEPVRTLVADPSAQVWAVACPPGRR